MSQAGNCTPSAKNIQAFLICNFKKGEGLKFSRFPSANSMSHAETFSSQLFVSTQLCRVRLPALQFSCRRSHLFLFFVSAQSNIVTLQLPVERRPADSKHFSSQRLVAMRLFEHTQNCHALHFRQRRRRKRSGIRSLHCVASNRLLRSNRGRQILHVHRF